MDLTLSKSEVLYIDDSVTLQEGSSKSENGNTMLEEFHATIRPISASGLVGMTQDFIDQLAAAIVYIIEGEKEEYTFDVDIFDVLALRELAQSSAEYASDMVGYSIKVKVAKTLLALRAEEEDGAKSKRPTSAEAVLEASIAEEMIEHMEGALKMNKEFPPEEE